MKPFEFNRFPVVVLFGAVLSLLFASSLYAVWQKDVRLTYDSHSSQTSWNNAWCVGANGSAVHVVWWDMRNSNGDIYYKRSQDGGASWGPDTNLTNETSASEYPCVSVSGSAIHVVWQDLRPPPNSQKYQILYKRSVNGGTSWGPDTRLTDTLQAYFYPSVSASGAVVHVVWGVDRGHGIYYRRSPDGGSSWDLQSCLDSSAMISYTPPSVSSSGNAVCVVWQDNRSGVAEIYCRRSTNGGISWFPRDSVTSNDGIASMAPSVSAVDSFVHVVRLDTWGGNVDVFYKRSTNFGASWGPDIRLTYNNGASSPCPSVSASGPSVHVVWPGMPLGNGNAVAYRRSTDNGVTWGPAFRLTPNTATLTPYPSVYSLGSAVHVVWQDLRDGNYEIYYKGNPQDNPLTGFRTEPSQGRHLVRDPARGTLHLVMQSDADSVYYSRSTNDGTSWSSWLPLGSGKNPTVGLAVLPEDVYPPYISVCVAYNSKTGDSLLYRWCDPYQEPGLGNWSSGVIISTPTSPVGAPALVTFGGTRVYVAHTEGSGYYLFCSDFDYNAPGSSVLDTIDYSLNCGQPSLAVDGGGINVHAAWKRGSEIYYAPRDSVGNWPSLRVDYTTDPSQHPFIECYGDRVYVVWSDDQPFAPNDVWQAWKYLGSPGWDARNNISLSSDSSASPTQAFGEFTTWSEGRASPDMFDIKYWSPTWDSGIVEPNPATWSSWTHSQMAYFWIPIGFGLGADLWSAWTESPNPGLPPFTVLTKKLTFYPPLGGGGDGFGSYYQVQAGQDAPSPYCRKRDGVIVFKDKAVDFAKDSLVYEFPYLDPRYDYFVKMKSYRETGVNWSEAISLDGKALRTVQFAPNKVDTAWVKLPYELYRQDRKVTFVAKKVSGDYVTRLGMTLYQVDLKRGKGGPQAGESIGLPVKEVFAVYPNPVTSQAQVEYSLQTPGQVNLSVYDVTGRMVREVVSGLQPAGVYKAFWDGRGQGGRLASTGVYFIKLNTPGRSKTARIVLVR